MSARADTGAASGEEGVTLVHVGPDARQAAPRFSVEEVEDLLSMRANDLERWIPSGDADRAHRNPEPPADGAQSDVPGESRYSWNDVELLRSARDLQRHKVPTRRIRAALSSLRRRLPASRSPHALALGAEGRRVVVQDQSGAWDAETGQTLFDFASLPMRLDDLHMPPESAMTGTVDFGEAQNPSSDNVLRFDDRRRSRLDAAGWYERARELEAADEAGVRAAYQTALELDPDLLDAHIDFGRYLHEAGDLERARDHYREALDLDPGCVTASFNLGVVEEDLGHAEEAVAAYTKTLALDPAYADAYYNLARLYEGRGDRTSALRCLQSYRRTRRGR